MVRPKVLSIAASDPTCGAGIQADIRTISLLGGHPLCCITAVTCQSSLEIKRVYPLGAEQIQEQIDVALSDGLPSAVKIGVLYDPEVVECVSEILQSYGLRRIVLDPVFGSSTGHLLISPGTYQKIAHLLLPLVDVITPNKKEAIELLRALDPSLRQKGREGALSLKQTALELKNAGPDIIITGGDTDGTDLLYDGKGFLSLRLPLIDSKNTHGTGCVFSSALATFLAFGFDLKESFRYAKIFVWNRIKKGYPIGRGHGVLGLP